jgi:uncharacterized protein YutE (UPF0331/DUF86 family)
MGSPAQAWSHEAEMEYLEGLRSRYEAEGFTFTIAPDRAALPSFLEGYLPDALAQKAGLNIAIEVKQHQSQTSQARLQDIRRLFDGRPDWQFSVAFIGTRPLQSVTIPVASPDAIRSRIEEVRSLNRQGLQRPAFVMAWSLLEAVLQLVEGGTNQKPLTPGTVVQTLAMKGYITADVERRMRSLIELRNRIVHGDVTAEPTAQEVDLILAAIDETLRVEAA